MGLQLCTPVGSVLRHVQTTDCLLPGLPSVDTEWSPPAMDAVPILLSLLSIPLVRGGRRLNLRLILTTDMDTDSDTDTVWDKDIVWDTDTVWDTPMADTMARDTVMDMDTATMDKMEALNSACAIVISTLA